MIIPLQPWSLKFFIEDTKGTERKGAWQSLGNGNVLYLDLDGGYQSVYN